MVFWRFSDGFSADPSGRRDGRPWWRRCDRRFSPFDHSFDHSCCSLLVCFILILLCFALILLCFTLIWLSFCSVLGSIDIVAVDTLGNLAAFNGKGETLWDRVLSGSVSQAPTLADLDEDGVLEVICAKTTVSVRRNDGFDAERCWFRAQNRWSAPPPLVMLSWSTGEPASYTKTTILENKNGGFLFKNDNFGGDQARISRISRCAQVTASSRRSRSCRFRE